LVFSAFEKQEMAKESIAAGADAYLEKGATVTQLVDILRELREAKGGPK
jgi:DNA-binding NarL/FixJ family response regulator